METSYQIIVHKANQGIIKDVLYGLLADSYEYYYEEIEGISSLNLVEIVYFKTISPNYNCIGFKIFHNESNSNANQIKTYFESKLKVTPLVEALFKFNDSFLLKDLRELYDEIHRIELSLREVITYIFADTYKENFYNFLYEIKVNALFEDKKLNSDIAKRKQYLQDKLENEFFYLLFSDYIKFNELENINIADIISYLDKTTNFEDFKTKLFSRGVNKAEYEDFITSLKANLNNIEKVRNCVAHNRSPSSNLGQDYQISYRKIELDINNFWKGVKDETQNIVPPDTFEIWELESWNKVDYYLENTEWFSEEKKVLVTDPMNDGSFVAEFIDVESFRDFLELEAKRTANSYMPTDESVKKTFEEEFDEEEIVNRLFEKYTIQLINMGWL